MTGAGSLLETVRGLIERTYRFDSGLAEIGSFIVGDRAWRRLLDEWVGRSMTVGSADGLGALTYLRETGEGVRAGIYFPDSLIERLESFPPQHGIGPDNVAEFATFVEEIDHLLVLAERVKRERPVTMFELELHANVTKYLVLGRFLAGRSPRLDAAGRLWLRRQVFGDARFDDDDPTVSDRYRDAVRWSVKLLEAVERRSPDRRLGDLRAFHGAEGNAKLRLIDQMTAG